MTSETQNQTTNSSTPTELLEGVQILIDRMEAYPQDFIYTGEDARRGTTPRFHHIASGLDSILHGVEARDQFIHLTTEEKAALLVAYRKMMRQAFTAQVIATTFDRDEPEEKQKRFVVQPVGQGVQNAVLTTTGNSTAFFQTNPQIIRQQAINEKLRELIATNSNEHSHSRF